MTQAQRLSTGNLEPHRGGSTRQHAIPDHQFDNEASAVYASWKAERRTSRCVGLYPSRAIANTAQREQWPLRTVDRHMRDAIYADVPLDAVKELIRLLERRAEFHHRRRHLHIVRPFAA